MKKPSPRQNAKGFSLIELLVVMAIVVILAAVSVGGLGYITKKQAYGTAELQINLLSKALEEYKLDNGEYPDPSSGSTPSNSLYIALYDEGASETPPQKIYLTELDPENNNQAWTSGSGNNITIVDPWGEEYIYRIGSEPSARNPDFDLISGGPDRRIGTGSDNVANF